MKTRRQQSGNCFHVNSERSEARLHTECVEDVGDEDKLAGVELDHGRVGQELGALENSVRVSVVDDDWTQRKRYCQLISYLDDYLQGFDLLVRGPGLLQGLVQLLDTVGVVLLGEVEKLPLGTLQKIGTCICT